MRRIVGNLALLPLLIGTGCAARTATTVQRAPASPNVALAEKADVIRRSLELTPIESSSPNTRAEFEFDSTFDETLPLTLADWLDEAGTSTPALVVADHTKFQLASAEDGAVPTLAGDLAFPLPPEPNAIPEAGAPSEIVVLNLPTALALVTGQHPVIGFAQWRLEEAYAEWDRAQVLWLPNLQAGTSFSRHDGQLQDSAGNILDVSRSSLQAGLGAGAVAAGPTPYPGLIANFAISDAVFLPRVAEKTSWARQHGVTAACNDQLRDVAISYVRVLAAKQDLAVLRDIHHRTNALARLTRDYAETGQGLLSDADRMLTETILVQNRVVDAQERVDVTKAQLIEAINLDYYNQIDLSDPVLLPIEMVSPGTDQTGLLTTGLRTRPELKEAQCLVEAACEEYKRQKYSPFIPSVLLGFSQSGFGGGQGITAGDFGPRVDYDAMALWQVRNLGFGERAARDQANSRIEQNRYEQLRLMNRVAREIAEARTRVVHRRERVNILQQGLQASLDSYDRNLARIRDGQGLPIEVLQSIQALEEAQRTYVTVVADYNEAQFQLQWALGWPVQ